MSGKCTNMMIETRRTESAKHKSSITTYRIGRRNRKTKKEWEIAAENENRIHRIKLFDNLIAHASFDLIRFLVGIIMLLLLLLCSRLCIMLGCNVSACNSVYKCLHLPMHVCLCVLFGVHCKCLCVWQWFLYSLHNFFIFFLNIIFFPYFFLFVLVLVFTILYSNIHHTRPVYVANIRCCLDMLCAANV